MDQIKASAEEINRALANYRDSWVALCVTLIILDVMLLGYLCIFNRSNEDWLEYLFQRVGALFLLWVISLVGELTPNVPILYLASLFYAGTSLRHMIRGLRGAGLKEIPRSFEQHAASLSEELPDDDEWEYVDEPQPTPPPRRKRRRRVSAAADDPASPS